MKKSLLLLILLPILLAGCGDSIKDSAENLKVTPKHTLIEILEESELIDDYKIEVVSDDLLKGEVKVFIRLKKDKIINTKYKDGTMILMARILMSQSVVNKLWTLDGIDTIGQFYYKNGTKSNLLELNEAIFRRLARNRPINIKRYIRLNRLS